MKIRLRLINIITIGFFASRNAIDDKMSIAWVKAIQNDNLDWAQVSDLKMWDSEAGRVYNISAIPASFMINPDGKIIGKNLRGSALKRFLEKNF